MLAILTTLAGCNPPPDDETEVVCENIGTQGGTVTSADSVLTIALRPGALQSDQEVCIRPAARPPDGPPLVEGPAYRVSPTMILAVPSSVGYRYTLPNNPSIVKIRAADYQAGVGHWLAVPTTRIDELNQLVTASDDELAMFYALEGDAFGGTTTGTTTTGTGTTSTSTTGTTSTTTGDESSTGGLEETGSDTTDAGTTSTSTSTSTSAAESSDGGAEVSSSDTGSDTAVGGCDGLPEPPLAVMALGTPFSMGDNEDIAMRGDGTIIGARTEGMRFLTAVDGDGGSLGLVPGFPDLPQAILGLAVSPSGDTIMAVTGNAGVYRVPAGGAADPDQVSPQPTSNGIYVDDAGAVWVTLFGNDAIVRITDVAAEAPVATPILAGAEDQVVEPNGIFLDEARGRLYWSNYSTADIYTATVDAQGVAGTPELIASDTDAGARWDGVTMDSCGHLYVVDQPDGAACRVKRILLADDGTAVDGTVTSLAADGAFGVGCSNAKFGFGFDDETYNESLFVTNPTNGGLYRMDVGVTGYPIPLP